MELVDKINKFGDDLYLKLTAPWYRYVQARWDARFASVDPPENLDEYEVLEDLSEALSALMFARYFDVDLPLCWGDVDLYEYGVLTYSPNTGVAFNPEFDLRGAFEKQDGGWADMWDEEGFYYYGVTSWAYLTLYFDNIHWGKRQVCLPEDSLEVFRERVCPYPKRIDAKELRSLLYYMPFRFCQNWYQHLKPRRA